MIKFNINIDTEDGIEPICTNEEVIKKSEEIFDYYLQSSEIKDKTCLCGYKFNTLSFDILFCNREKTHEINKEYRGKDYPADIITFALFADSPKEERLIQGLEINLGEIIIALDKICENAKEKKISDENELIFMISHGIMHLLGFEHETDENFNFVVKQQKKALESIGIKYDKI